MKSAIHSSGAPILGKPKLIWLSGCLKTRGFEINDSNSKSIDDTKIINYNFKNGQ